MKRKSGSVFLSALLTAALITLFQVFWLWQNFQSSSAGFLRAASNSLQKSINAYQLQQNARFLNGKDSTMTLYLDTSAKQLIGRGKWQSFRNGLSPANQIIIHTLMSGMLSQALDSPIAMKAIRAIYRQLLLKDGMPADFSFTVYPDSSYLRGGQVSATLGLSSNSPVVVAGFTGVHAYLLKKNLTQLLVSILLLLITFFCLWYMQSVIAEQARLDRVKNDFINNMAHEFRTPVTILRSTHEALAGFGGLDSREKTLRYLQANESVLRKMQQDLDRVLTLAPFEKSGLTVKPETISVDALLTETTAPFRLAADVELQTGNQLGTDRIISDPYMLGAILFNLVDNAIKYGGRTVIITLSPADSEHWQLEIQDDGCGIDRRHLPYIFEKFYRVPQGDRHDSKGFGLGLSYVKELTAALGGTIDVDSLPGNGTLFRLVFPWKK